jgi:hypothetical protein
MELLNNKPRLVAVLAFFAISGQALYAGDRLPILKPDIGMPHAGYSGGLPNFNLDKPNRKSDMSLSFFISSLGWQMSHLMSLISPSGIEY